MSGPGFDDVRRFDRIDSTNRYLLDEARLGAPEGVVAVADYQTAGRGRLGRRWEAPPRACLLTSVLLRPVVAPDELFLTTGLVAVAALAACETVAGVRPGLKWPNDLVVGDAKLAGLLAESDPGAPGGPPGSTAVVVGVGLNVSWPGPPDAGGTSLAAQGAAGVGRDELLEALLGTLAARRPALDDAAGRRGLLAEVRTRCVTLGRRVRVALRGAEVVGRAAELAGNGQLVVETDDGPRRAISAGDVVHLRPA